MRERFQQARSGNKLYFTFLLSVALVRLVWFQGRVLAGGDLLVPMDSPGFLRARLSTWDTVDLGMPSGLVARVFSPLYGLVALSQVATGSAVYGEAIFLVGFTFLAAVSVWWLTDYLADSKRSRISLLVTSLFYECSMFLINDGLHTTILFLHTYALLPLIAYLMMRATSEGRHRFAIISASLTIFVSSTMPNFRDLAFLAIILAFFVTYCAKFRRFNRFSWKVVGTFLVGSTLLNLAWILPLVVNIDYWAAGLSSVPVSGVTQLSSGLERILRGIGKWGFDSGYNGLLYHPYSEVYFSPAFIILGYSFTALSFAAILIARPTKPALLMMSFSLVFVFLAKGVQPPFGQVYAALVLLGPLRAFRESFYFMQFVALGYAYLVGEFADAVRRFDTSRLARLWPRTHRLFQRRPESMLGGTISILLVGAILANSWPLFTGAVAENWSTPGINGVQFPQQYYDAAARLKRESELPRLLILPVLGDYVAYRWGYQGGSDIFNGLFRQPVIAGSSWSEYTYPTRNQVREVLEAIKSNDSDNFRALAYWFSIRFLLLDKSRDTDFYHDPPITYYEEFLPRAGFQVVDRFGFLWLYEYPYALPRVYNATTAVPQNSSIASPLGTLWSMTDFSSGWAQKPSVVERRGNATYAAFVSNGTYVAYSLVINKSIEPGGYSLISFATNNETSIAVAARTPSRFYLSALNPPGSSPINHYRSITPYVLAFVLPSAPISSLEVFVTNRFSPNFVGNLEIWLSLITEVKDIGRPRDLFQRISPANQSAVVISPSDFKSYFSGTQQAAPTSLNVTVVSQTKYEIRYTSTRPFVLVLNDAFDRLWEAKVDGAPAGPHFRTNGFSNGWIIPAGKEERVVISFALQTPGDLGLATSILSLAFICLMVLVLNVRRRRAVGGISGGGSSPSRQSRTDFVRYLVEGDKAPAGKVLNLGSGRTRVGDINVDLRGNPEVLADARYLPFRERTFSTVVFADVIEHLPRDSEIKALREIWRVLADKGRLIVSTPRRDGLWGFLFLMSDPAFWILGHRHYTRQRLTRLFLDSGFEIEYFTTRGTLREAIFSLITPILFAKAKVVPSKQTIRGGDYSKSNLRNAYTHIVTTRKKAS